MLSPRLPTPVALTNIAFRTLKLRLRDLHTPPCSTACTFQRPRTPMVALAPQLSYMIYITRKYTADVDAPSSKPTAPPDPNADILLPTEHSTPSDAPAPTALPPPTAKQIEDAETVEHLLLRCEELVGELYSIRSKFLRKYHTRSILSNYVDLSAILLIVTNRDSVFEFTEESVELRRRQRARGEVIPTVGLPEYTSLEGLLTALENDEGVDGPAAAEDAVIAFLDRYVPKPLSEIFWLLIDKALLGATYETVNSVFASRVSSKDIEATLLRCEELDGKIAGAKPGDSRKHVEMYPDLATILKLVTNRKTSFGVSKTFVTERMQLMKEEEEEEEARKKAIAEGSITVTEPVPTTTPLFKKGRRVRPNFAKEVAESPTFERLEDLFAALEARQLLYAKGDKAVMKFMMKHVTPRTEEIFWKLLAKRIFSTTLKLDTIFPPLTATSLPLGAHPLWDEANQKTEKGKVEEATEESATEKEMEEAVGVIAHPQASAVKKRMGRKKKNEEVEIRVAESDEEAQRTKSTKVDN